MVERIDILQNRPVSANQAPVTTLYWIGAELVKRRVVVDTEPTDNYTPTGQRIMKKVGQHSVPVQLQIVDKYITMPNLGESIRVPEHLVSAYMAAGRVTIKDTQYEGFTTDPEFAKAVATAFEEGKPTPVTYTDAAKINSNVKAQVNPNDLTIEELEAMLEERKGSSGSKSTSRSKSKS